jgi:hypothetical protein
MLSKPSSSKSKSWSLMVGENQWIKQNMSPLGCHWKINQLKDLWKIERT